MAQKHVYEMTVRLTYDQRKRIDEIASRDDLSPAVVARQCLRRGLDLFEADDRLRAQQQRQSAA